VGFIFMVVEKKNFPKLGLRKLKFPKMELIKKI